MSELHKFIFDGLPVRGSLVRLDGAWQELLGRRAANTQTGAYPAPVVSMLGQMTAATLLLQASIRFEGQVVLQVRGDGPVDLAVAEVDDALRFRATASFADDLPATAGASQLINAGGKGRCSLILDPAGRRAGAQPYQGIVPLADAAGRPLPSVAAMIERYMQQSEQLATTVMLAADGSTAAGLMLQRLPGAAGTAASGGSDAEPAEDDFVRLSVLARSLQAEELLQLDADIILRRLFWNENLLRLQTLDGLQAPRFHCRCSRQRVASMLRGLGQEEIQSVLAEQGVVEVTCEFCGQQERFDKVDVATLFTQASQRSPRPGSVQ